MGGFLECLFRARERALNSPDPEFYRMTGFVIINFYVLILSMIMVIKAPDTMCEKSLMIALTTIGAVWFFFSLINLACTFVGVSQCKPLFCVFMTALSVTIVLLLIVIVSIYLVTSGDARWLRDRFIDGDGKWDKIKSCYIHHNVCNETAYTVYGTKPTLDEFRIMSLNYSSTQHACCKPAGECNFGFVSPTEWTKPASLVTIPDCKLWRNDDSTLCFDCASCKAEFIDKLKNEWRRQARDNIPIFIQAVISYCIGCGVLLLWPNEKKESRGSAPSLGV